MQLSCRTSRAARAAHLCHSCAPFFVICIAACSEARSSADLDVAAVPLLALDEKLRIGSVDDPEAGFSAISEVDVDRDGNIYVFEQQDLQIRAYGPDGSRLRTIGRRGSGPGEFQTYARFGVVGDTIWTIESGRTRRISLFTRAGVPLVTSGPIEGVRIAQQSGRMDGIVLPQWMMPGGKFTSDMTTYVSRRDSAPSGVKPGDTIRVPRVVFDSKGVVLDTIGYDLKPPPPPSPPMERLEIEGRPYRVPTPPSAAPVTFALDDGRIYIERPVAASAEKGVFTVTRLDLRRDTVYHRRFRYQPKKYSEAVLDTIVALVVRIPTGGFRIVNGQPVYPDPPSNPDEVHRVLRDAVSFPPFIPPVQYYRRGNDGTVWLQREDNGELEFDWIILNADGLPVGKVRIPRSAQIVWNSRDVLWLVKRDEFDVPWLVKYQIRR